MSIARKNNVSVELVRKLFNYDQTTGIVTRAVECKTGKSRVGEVVGYRDKSGHLCTRILRKEYQLHRVIWAIATGSWPSGDIDHIDGQPDNNRLANLRDVSRKTNLENQRNGRRSNATGFLGVAAHYGKFRARIHVDKQTITLGLFDTPEAAHAAYLQAKRQLHAGCTI